MDPTSNDFEARRTIWDSKIPVEFALDSSESVLATQQSCFMMLPRASYFPVYLDKALRILTGGDASEEQLLNAWLQYDGQVLKWHYPIGVLYDIAHGTVFDQTSPWTIIVHLKNFPDELIRCRTKETLKFYFLQSLKEACQLKHRHNIASSMTKDEHARLFDGLYNERFNDFWEVNERLMSFKSPISGDEFGKIPARFYESPHSFRQLLLNSRNHFEDGTSSETLLIDTLQKAFPGYLIETGFEAMVCVPCIILPFVLAIYLKFVQPFILRFVPQRWKLWFDSVLYPTCPVKPTTDAAKMEKNSEDSKGSANPVELAGDVCDGGEQENKKEIPAGMGRPFLEHMGGKKYYTCFRCKTYLTNKREVLSQTFRGATGQAYLFRTVVNIVTAKVESRFMITGQHMVRDVFCKTCNFKLGWMPRYFGAKTARRTRGNGSRTCGAEPTTDAYFLVIFREQQRD
uniref:Autophagy protein 5 n=1 Tax=Globodera rostochiensis TaxID=31243 RepID=A0A914HD85_GLORO